MAKNMYKFSDVGNGVVFIADGKLYVKVAKEQAVEARSEESGSLRTKFAEDTPVQLVRRLAALGSSGARVSTR